MPSIRRHRLTAPLALTAASLFLLARFAAGESGQSTVEVVLSNLPVTDSPAYVAIYNAAGHPHRDILDMTKAEVWAIPGDKWSAVTAAAANAGVKLTKLDEGWNRVMTPMAKTGAMTSAQASIMHEEMDSKAAVTISMMALGSPSVEEYALTKGMHDTDPTAPRPKLLLPLAEGKTVTAVRIAVAPVAGGYAWHGAVEETGEAVTLLWWPSGKMSGSVTYKGHVYAVHDLGNGLHTVIEMNPAMMPPEHAPMGFDMMKKMHLKEDPLVMRGDASVLMGNPQKLQPAPDKPDRPDRSRTRNQEDAGPAKTTVIAPGPMDITHTPLPADETREQATIRLIIVYTKAAAAHYNDIETDLIPLAIEDANESFRNSGITNVNLELAYAYETNYVESGTHFDHVFRFADKGDGYMDEVHELRDKYQADVGILIVNDPNGCGLSAEVHARPDRAFAVVHHECAANMYSMAHEIGHLIGARHDEALDDEKQPFAFGHGFVYGKSWRTMMSYKDSCDGCPRVPVWSSPMVKVQGVPAGNAASDDNARVIAENAARVAKFRFASRPR